MLYQKDLYVVYSTGAPANMELVPDLSPFPCVGDNEAAYTRSFENYREKANEATLIHQWIREKFDPAVVQNLFHEDNEKLLKVLGVGSGDGEFEFEMLIRLAKKFPIIECTVVEPSEKRITLYKKLVEDRKTELKDVTWEWRHETLEQHLGGNNKTFDLVICVHVLYFYSVTDLKGRLQSLCRLLTEDGRLLIIHNQESQTLKLLDKFTLNRRPVMTMNHRAIRDALVNLNVSFILEETLTVVIDVTECFDPHSTEGGPLLDFMVRADPQWRSALEPREVRAVIRLIKEACIQADGKWKFAYPAAVLLCQNAK